MPVRLCSAPSPSTAGVETGLAPGRVLSGLEAGQCPKLGNVHARAMACCRLRPVPRVPASPGDGLDNLRGGVLDVCKQAPGAPTQDVQQPSVGLVVLGNYQACKQRWASGHGWGQSLIPRTRDEPHLLATPTVCAPHASTGMKPTPMCKPRWLARAELGSIMQTGPQ